MNNEIYRTLGKAVKDSRREYGWSQEELGGRADLHPSYIGQIERATKKVSLLTLHKLARALRMKLADLLKDKVLKNAPASWEKKISGIIRHRPVKQQEFAYRLIKEALRAFE